MFTSILDLFKIGIGPSSSHTMGPMVAALDFRQKSIDHLSKTPTANTYIQCELYGSLAFTGKGHATDTAVMLGLHGHAPNELACQSTSALVKKLTNIKQLTGSTIGFEFEKHITFMTKHPPLSAHPNGLILKLCHDTEVLLEETYFSVGGGFIQTKDTIDDLSQQPIYNQHPYYFETGNQLLSLAKKEQLTIAQIKWQNELCYLEKPLLIEGINQICQAMFTCIKNGLSTNGMLPGNLKVERRAQRLHRSCLQDSNATVNDWLCAYAMSVNEENAAGHMVVTAPTNGAAGVIPAVLYYLRKHENIPKEKIQTFLLTAAAIGGLIKHNSSISGAEVGCQGEVGSAAAMAAAGACAAKGGSTIQIENAAEMALEHHLGMTCDPVGGLVQVPCIERNGFGAIKAYTAASLALKGSGKHVVSLDNCIATMKQTGLDMHNKYKETSLGGLAVNVIEC